MELATLRVQTKKLRSDLGSTALQLDSIYNE